jgi:hypothetical protein
MACAVTPAVRRFHLRVVKAPIAPDSSRPGSCAPRVRPFAFVVVRPSFNMATNAVPPRHERTKMAWLSAYVGLELTRIAMEWLVHRLCARR